MARITLGIEILAQSQPAISVFVPIVSSVLRDRGKGISIAAYIAGAGG
jgi:hypothetical protein